MVSPKDIGNFLQTLKSDVVSGNVSFNEVRSSGDKDLYISEYKGRRIGLQTDGKLFFGASSAKTGTTPHREVPHVDEDAVKDLIDLVETKNFSSMYEDYVKKVINDG